MVVIQVKVNKNRNKIKKKTSVLLLDVNVLSGKKKQFNSDLWSSFFTEPDSNRKCFQAVLVFSAAFQLRMLKMLVLLAVHCSGNIKEPTHRGSGCEPCSSYNN